MSTMSGAGGFDGDEDFYEDDEPVEKVMAAFERGRHGITTPPITIEIDTRGLGVPPVSTATQPAAVKIYSEPVLPVRPVAVSVEVAA